jgi:flagellin
MAFGDINRVNTNLQSLSAQYSLNKINQQLANNQMQLSTGLRINKAQDDAAGFSIASKIRGKLAGMNQASRNIGDAKSMMNIAESGLNSIMDSLIQMKSKATEGASGTLGATERGYVQKQIEALGNEINTVAGNTKYNGSSLLSNSGSAISKTFQVGDGSSDTYSVSINDSTTLSLFSSTGAGTGVGTNTTGAGGFTMTGSAQSNFQNLLTSINTAIDTLAGTTNQMGIDQNNLSIRQDNLSQAITSNNAAKSRIMDANFAQVKSDSVRLQILQQTATAALTQANSSPQSVLTILRG